MTTLYSKKKYTFQQSLFLTKIKTFIRLSCGSSPLIFLVTIAATASANRGWLLIKKKRYKKEKKKRLRPQKKNCFCQNEATKEVMQLNFAIGHSLKCHKL